jgi:hypothetical protein
MNYRDSTLFPCPGWSSLCSLYYLSVRFFAPCEDLSVVVVLRFGPGDPSAPKVGGTIKRCHNFCLLCDLCDSVVSGDGQAGDKGGDKGTQLD